MIDSQIHSPDKITNQIQTYLQEYGGTFEQSVQQVVAHELQRRKAKDLKSFFDALQPLESFADIDAVFYVDGIRGDSRLIYNSSKPKY